MIELLVNIDVENLEKAIEFYAVYRAAAKVIGLSF